MTASTISESHTNAPDLTTIVLPENNPETPDYSNVNPEMPPNQDIPPESPVNPETPHNPDGNLEAPHNPDANLNVNPDVNPELPSKIETATTTAAPPNPEANNETHPDAAKEAQPKTESSPAADAEIPEVHSMMQSGFELPGMKFNSEPNAQSELKSEEANRVDASELNGLIDESGYNLPENFDPNGETADTSIISGDINSNAEPKGQIMIPIEQYRF